MIWHDKNTHGGQLVASQTTHGDFKDVQILSAKGSGWLKISLLDGLCQEFANKQELTHWLNKHSFVPIAKLIGEGNLPENRAELPAVQITGLRKNP